MYFVFAIRGRLKIGLVFVNLGKLPLQNLII